MNHSGAASDDVLLNESSLPVELQSKNVINSTYTLATIPVTVLNGGGIASSSYNGTGQGEPLVHISEEPQQRGFRFRYECEGPSHGGLQGTRSERSRKSYPTIKVENYTGACRVVVTLVTDEKTPREHAHKLVGTNCKNGFCYVEIKANSEPISFPNISILHVTRKKLVDVLTERILDNIRLNKKLAANNMNLDHPITDEDHQIAKQRAEDQSKNMQLNVVRLCFQVFLRNPDGSFSRMLTPVFSQPIYDSKSPGASALKICRMDKYGGCCSGNEEVFLLCEKVQKDDIQVRFVEQNENGTVKWEAYGNFGPLDVHRQYAIVFKTPAYWNTNIDKAVNVLIMLQRKSDKEVSEPKAFTYFPQNRDKDKIASKKRKRIPLDTYDFGGDGASGFGSGMGGDGSNGGGDGGMDHPGGGGDPNPFMMMHGADIPGSNFNYGRVLPQPVQDAATHEMFRPRVELESERLRASLATQSCDNLLDSDPWICSDVEVDAVPEPVQAQGVGPHTQSAGVKLSSIEGEDDSVDEGRRYDLKCAEMSIDSAVGKSLHTVDVKTSQESYRPPVFRWGLGEGKEETSKSTFTSDYHSESDIKTDVTSEGVKSDEGFSETSEEAASKGQQLLQAKKREITATSETVKGLSLSEDLKLTDVLRKVTNRVAERTISALVDFAETGDIRHLLLVQRQLMTVSNENGDLPLHLAVINSQPVALKSLVDVMCTLTESKHHINALNFMRQTPLHLAAITNQPKIVETLLHAGADPSIADRHGNTAAHLAVMNGSQRCLTSLVKYLRPGQTKADPFPELNHLNYDGFSPLHLATQAGNVNMLRVLIFGQADVNLPDGKSGKTALHHAVDNDDLPVAGFLLMDADTYVNARCFDGNTALHIACARQLVAMVALLVTAGADQNCENEEIPDQEGAGLDRVGLRPVDYAEDNQQILKILCGETVPDNFLLSTIMPSEERELMSRISQVSLKDRPGSSQLGVREGSPPLSA